MSTSILELKKRIKQNIDNANIREYFKEQLRRLVDLIFDYVDVEGILLYGSVARGDGIPLKSDIDIIVISSSLPPDGIERTIMRRKFARVKPKDIEIIWATPKEFEIMYRKKVGLILDALYDGIILFDRTGFLKRFKERFEDELAKGKIQRRKGYWVIQEWTSS